MPAIALSRTRALDDSDGATRQTVEKMCELIRESASDPYVQRCAAYARDRFAMGSADPAALTWGVFWYVKHCVKFRLDEGTMLQVGESHDAYGQQQQDLLIAPAVLVRMKDPSEDCDGFTMLTAALLTCLGIPVVIATVATDMDDPTRWSHVFLCAIVNGRVKPLDTSHGAAPGWMVPRHRINRWQTWTLDGRPASVQIPSFQGLHAYQTFPGLGATGYGRSRRMRPPVILVPRGRGFGGWRGLGQAGCATATCDSYADDGVTCLEYDDSSCSETSVNFWNGGQNPFGFQTSVSTAACADGYVLYNSGTCIPASGTLPPCGGGGTQAECVNGAPPASVTPNYAAVASAAVAAIGQDVKAVVQQPQALLNAQTWANLSGYLPIIGIAVLGVVLISSIGGKR